MAFSADFQKSVYDIPFGDEMSLFSEPPAKKK